MQEKPNSSTYEGIIHLIDDEDDIVRIATTALQNSDYAVHSFTDGSKAVKDMESNCKDKVSMVITDIRMPGYSGFDLARRAREIKPGVPMIFMTAFEINDIEFEKVFPSLHVNAFLQKPFHIKKLLDVVEEFSQR